MATVITISYSDGSQTTHRYRLSKIARIMKQMRGIEKFSDLRYTPITPWIVEIALNKAEETASSREITKIEIQEKTT
jgi:hypothetical protein